MGLLVSITAAFTGSALAFFSSIPSVSSSDKALFHVFGESWSASKGQRSPRAFIQPGAERRCVVLTPRAHTLGITVYSMCVYEHVCVAKCDLFHSIHSTILCWACYCSFVDSDRKPLTGCVCVVTVLCDGTVLCPVTKLFNNSKLTPPTTTLHANSSSCIIPSYA